MNEYENIKYGRKVCASPMPEYVSASMPMKDIDVNCLIFTLRPPREYPLGNLAHPIAIILNPGDFVSECRKAYLFFKDRSTVLIPLVNAWNENRKVAESKKNIYNKKNEFTTINQELQNTKIQRGYETN